ncbi:hypothetical protein [Candidatus Enterococcus mansonii]|uniref:Uncharacterized protein n=1 Tax=Candidatus Enterococcus mansonii TaxID=1834181 RepID=A0A242BYF5_9ENTE|nr:hypothetical protein [Enterococcus sp. 4G2_DIV0659]OTO03043.1 hypothetical protein A5880_003154 [Enterococcus sp. 4G2_DIV0659]
MVLPVGDLKIIELSADYQELKKEISGLSKSTFSTSLNFLKIIKLYKKMDQVSNALIQENEKNARLYFSEMSELNQKIAQDNSKEKSADEEEAEDFGNCEECGCELSYLPNAGWGVGYVCASCARELRGENEY